MVIGISTQNFNKLAAAIIFILSLSTLAAWLLPVSESLHFLAALKSMAFSTALLLTGVGLALYTLSHAENLIRSLVASSCIVVGLLNFSDYWLFRETLLSTQGPHAGHMAIGTALNFVLVGICFLLYDFALKKQKLKFDVLFFSCIFFVFCVAFGGLLENFIQMPTGTTHFGGRMAPHSSISFFICSAVLAINHKLGPLKTTDRLSIVGRLYFGFGFSALLTLCVGLIFFSHSTAIEFYLQNNEQIRNHLPSKTSTELLAMVAQSNSILLYSAIALFLFNITSLSLIGQSLKRQIEAIRHFISQLSYGKLDSTIPFYDYNNEIGEISKALMGYSDVLRDHKNTEEKFKTLIENLPLGIIVSNREGSIVVSNTLSEKMFGYTAEQFSHLKIEQLLPNQHTPQHQQLRENYFSNPQPRTMGNGQDLFALRSDNTLFPVEVGLMPLSLSSEMLVIATVADISDRKLRESKIDHQRELLEITTKATEVGLWELYVASGRLNWSDSMFALYGRNPIYFQNTYEDWRQTVHPEDIQQAEQKFLSFMKNKDKFNEKFRIIKPDGSVRYILAKARFYTNRENEEMILGTNIDITTEELLSKKIHEVENLRSAIVEYSDDAIYSKTPFGIVTSWNNGAERIFGFTAAEAIGKMITDLIFPDYKKQEIEDLQAEVREGKTISHYETICINKNGDRLDISISLSPIKDAHGQVIGISSIKRDISRSKIAERLLAQRQFDLEKLNEALAKSNQDLEAFAHVASHDLKSPLRGIAQIIGWMEQDLNANKKDDIQSNMLSIRKRISRMEKLLDDLLLFYRVDQNYGEIVEIHLSDFIADIFEVNNPMRGMSLQLIGPMPDIKTYLTPLEIVLRNLISNAAKHHDKPEGILTISCKAIDTDWWEFSVADDGPGIAEKYHDRVFKMFQTLKPRDQVEGSGIGLTLIQKIIQGFGGKICIVSQGRGTNFVFTWPRHHPLTKDQPK